MSRDIVTICICASRSIIDRAKALTVSKALDEAGYAIRWEADLCEKAVSSRTDMQEIASSTVIACYPRAVFALFDRLSLTPTRVLDIRNNAGEEILADFHLSIPSATDDSLMEKISALPCKSGQDAWYPLIDKNRCCNCGKCYDFCLFGVYAIEERVVKVRHPGNCKINCPACARNCPEKAIIFPKYLKSPVNGGLTEEEFLAVNTKTLYSEALMQRIERRRANGLSLKRKNDDH